ncbi:MFS transporter [Enemella evansiae]|uniref:MFS transporter n=1 Tax=Enemella evansiae TaxID=2016499 RepID=UPI001061AC24|nr:MFS transporter [Enemella evansiae]TDO93023.1 DHA2 family methylenomycin A resistance protein-like MFS transporter [Enemella evansiae]
MSFLPRTTPAPTRNRYLLTVLCIPMFLVLLDVLAMNVAMPTLGTRFGVPTTAWPQLVDAYTVPLAVGLLPAGALVDRVGPRRTLLVGLAGFLAASALGGLGWDWASVLIARAVQGAAAALMLPAGLAALTAAWPDPAARARALGIWSAVSAVATALGPAVGGLLVQALSWRAVFWINVPLVLTALVGTAALVRDHHPEPGSGARPSRLRCLIASVVTAAIMTSGANGSLQVLTVHLQRDLRLNAGTAGLVLLIATIPFALLGPVSGVLVTRIGRRVTAALGFGLGAIGYVCLGRIGSGVISTLPALLGIGFGLGLMTSAIVGESMAAWPTRPGLAAGWNNALRQAGTSVGVALGGVLSASWSGSALLQRSGLLAGGWWSLGAILVLVGFQREGQ